jgi:hypothetical protein
MKPFAPLLSLALAAAAGDASAQTSRYYGTDAYYGGDRDVAYPQPVYDYARVLRVDPVIDPGYRGRNVAVAQNCRYRRADDVYAGSERYGDDGYGNGGYRDYRDDYRDHGYGGDGYGGRGEIHRDGGTYGRDDGYAQPGSETGRTVATVIGGIAGAVLGSKVGEGSGRYVGTAVGSMVGGIAGRSIYESTQRGRPLARRGTVRVCDPLPAGADGYYDGSERLSGYEVTYEYAGRTYVTRTDHHPGDRLRVRVDVRPE